MRKFLFSALCAVLLMATAAVAAVNINTATVNEIAKLNGIGPAKAQAIVDYRTQHGSFASTADLTKVKGIGSKTVEKLGKEITIEN
ncbi:ComEA family DNA-binding protein [Thiovibrio sp. JS02]